ncbi:hypothetical protein JW933_00045, partial [candidate division FCPU426 bacterium]|nr:hypothetical protein [candidate division FCPU426 bacterium]
QRNRAIENRTAVIGTRATDDPRGCGGEAPHQEIRCSSAANCSTVLCHAGEYNQDVRKKRIGARDVTGHFEAAKDSKGFYVERFFGCFN